MAPNCASGPTGTLLPPALIKDQADAVHPTNCIIDEVQFAGVHLVTCYKILRKVGGTSSVQSLLLGCRNVPWLWWARAGVHSCGPVAVTVLKTSF